MSGDLGPTLNDREQGDTRVEGVASADLLSALQMAEQKLLCLDQEANIIFCLTIFHSSQGIYNLKLFTL